jgi:uncharacterized delta-60 repeat protein
MKLPNTNRTSRFVFITLLTLALFAAGVRAGSLDPNFGTGGKVTTDVFETDHGTRVFVLPDGKILAAGQSTSYNQINHTYANYTMLARYNSDGTLDSTFGTNGKVHDTAAVAVSDVLLQADGKIVMVGTNNPSWFQASGDDFAVLRFNANGSRDTGFGSGGLVVTNFGGSIDLARAAVLTSDGKILVTGVTFGTSNTAGTIDLARYNSDGTPDNTFGTGGIRFYSYGPVNSSPQVTNLAMLSDGKFIVLTHNVAARFNPDGTFDTSFGSLGIADGGGLELIRQPDGKFIVLPSEYSVPTDGFNMIRRNADWSIDTGFGVNGAVKSQFRAPVGDYEGQATAVALKANGEIYQTGWGGRSDYSTRLFGVGRYSSSGVELAKTEDNLGTNPTSDSLALQPDGKVVVVGGNATDLIVARYSAITNGIQFTYHRTYDFNGDGKDDITVYRPGSGGGSSVWYSTSAASPYWQFGLAGDLIAPADFTGDGVADLAVFRPSTGYWYIANSLVNPGGNFTAVQWGASGDVPTAADYDGDGKDDIAVFRPSTGIWYIRQSHDGVLRAFQWGTAGDVPVVGDYDGDGECDLAVYRPSSGVWYILKSTDSQVLATQFGAPGDISVAGDYDGDRRTDLAVFRPGTGVWYLIKSSTNTFTAQYWGVSGDVPAPGDFDGDGKTDFAVVRPTGVTGFWYILNSSNSSMQSVQWGLSTDTPVPGK